MKVERVIAYIDGFNLYFGLKEKGWSCYYWLNLKLLCHNLPKDPKRPQTILLIKYFTSRISGPPDKRRRQSVYIDALNTVQGIKPYYGRYHPKQLTCKQCGYINEEPEEKMTDVQLAIELVSDAYQNSYDTAFVISGDRDLVPAFETIRAKPLYKRAIAVFPPMRTNSDLKGVSDGFIHITDVELKKSLFPKEIPTVGGYVLRCPSEWYE